jgi:hypothetical protein
MVRVGRVVVIRYVASATGRWCACVSIRVAFNAGRGRVRSVQGEGRVVVVEGGGAP